MILQGSPEWFAARCGNATASRFADVIAKGQGKTRAKYLRQIVAERLTGKPCESFRGNADTERGQQQEPLCREEYEAETGNIVQLAGFIRHPKLAAGCSPDGLVGKDGGGEYKCVIPTTQVDTILAGDYPSEHKPQVQGNLWITEREWWDFCSFCPDMLEERHRLYVFRVYRDDAYIRGTLEPEVTRFCDDVDRVVDTLMGRDNTEALLRQSLVNLGKAA